MEVSHLAKTVFWWFPWKKTCFSHMRGVCNTSAGQWGVREGGRDAAVWRPSPWQQLNEWEFQGGVKCITVHHVFLYILSESTDYIIWTRGNIMMETNVLGCCLLSSICRRGSVRDIGNGIWNTSFLLWVAQIHLQWCLLRTLQFWEIAAFPSCSHHHNLPLSSPPPGRKIRHFMRKNMPQWAKLWFFAFL